MKKNPKILFLKSFAAHKGRPHMVGGSLPRQCSSSSEIETEAQAKDYFQRHFVDGSPHRIECRYGKKRYEIYVHFERNHAYTEDRRGTGRDEDRSFSLDRARGMDSIWRVLNNPGAVTWSRSGSAAKRKQFDAALHVPGHELGYKDYGRVILEPIPTPEDIAKGRVTHFLFVTWHPTSKAKFNGALKDAINQRINPTTLRKALMRDIRALLFLPRTLSAATLEDAPASEGIPFDWTSYFYDAHCRKSFGDSGRDTKSAGDYITEFDLQKALEPGQRWITVHPNGKDEKGVPVLIQETRHGSGVYHVVGGAGGKLNYLKLRGIKPESSYKEQARERAAQKRLERKEQAKRDKEAGIHQAKQEARTSVANQKKAHERKFIETVAEAMGWDAKDLEFDASKHANLSEKALAKLAADHHRTLLKRAKEAVDIQRQALIHDAEARQQAGVNGIPLQTDHPDTLSVQDLDPVKPDSGGYGFQPNYKERAGDESDIKSETSDIKAEDQASLTDAQKRAIEERKSTAEKIKAEIKAAREETSAPDLQARIIDAQKAVELLKAEKALKAAQQQARVAQKDIDKSSEVKAYHIEVGDDPELDEKISSDLENDLRTARTRAFLSEIKAVGGEESLGKHLGVGAYNALNSVSLTAAGVSLVDRSVVDVLGVAGAAQVLAQRLRADLKGPEIDDLAEAMQDYHVHHYMETADASLKQADELLKAAKRIELGEAHDGHDLTALRELNAKRQDAINEAHKILGQALGEMEMNAALIMALKQSKPKDLEVPMGGISIEDAIRQARAIGLSRGDYTIDTIAGNRVLTVKAEALSKLASPVDRESIEQVRRNLDIIKGKYDEEGWLPSGVASRPDLVMDVKHGVAPRLAKPFEPGDDLESAIKDYIGGRIADGDNPVDVLADLQSLDFMDKVGGRVGEYLEALNKVAPMKDESGKPRRIEELMPEFEKLADEFTERHYGGKIAPLHRQQFEINEHATEALHRALAAEPAGVAAYKPIGELTNQDQRAIRDYFAKHIAKESPEAGELRHRLEKLDAEEPEKESEDMFGEVAENPEWRQWKQERDEIAEKLNASSLTWDKYVTIMHGHQNAYAAIQDQIRSSVSRSFAETYNKLNPKNPLKLGRAVIRNNLNHLDAIDPEARDARLEQHRQLVDRLRERDSRGRYSEGAVSDKIEAYRNRQEAMEQAQMGFFADDGDLFGDETETKPEKPLGADERYTLGHAAERQIAGMMHVVGRNFKPGQPVKLWQPSMSGEGIARQRAIKMIEANKRVALAAGVGSGKSLMMLAGFTHLQAQGKAKRALYLVPSVVQGQFSGEALRYLEPGKFNWHIEPGASRDERIAAYKNPDYHFAVMTHQSFRDDMLHLGAQHAGVDVATMRDRLNAMKPAERKAWLRSVMDKEGINFDYLGVDEGHNTLNRQGKENSGMANMIDALSANTEYYVFATADPTKNDVSEAYDLLAKMAPDQYTDRAAFMRKYGVDTAASKEALKREMAKYVFPSKVEPNVKVSKQEINVELSEGQKKAISEIEQHVAKARIARMTGGVDVDAIKAVAPNLFKDAPKERHEEIAKEIQGSLGIVKQSAIKRIIDAHTDSAKLDRAVQAVNERRGKPGVIFAHSLEAVQTLKERLEKEGHRVVHLTGADSSKVKAQKIQAFNPDAGEPKADILITSDAGATGMNAQRGQWLIQYDTPDTAMTHAQRRGRIHRIGQKNNVELIDLVANHAQEKAARKRLGEKYELRDIMTSPMETLDDTGLAMFLKRRQQDQASMF